MFVLKLFLREAGFLGAPPISLRDSRAQARGSLVRGGPSGGPRRAGGLLPGRAGPRRAQSRLPAYPTRL